MMYTGFHRSSHESSNREKDSVYIDEYQCVSMFCVLFLLQVSLTQAKGGEYQCASMFFVVFFLQVSMTQAKGWWWHVAESCVLKCYRI